MAPETGPELSFKDEPKVPREIPVRLGRYLIDGEIVRGGMGVVYRGRQEGLDRVVAIKLLLGGAAADAEMVQRFRREARAAARLRHPNIVAIHEVGKYEGRPFFSMDFIPGKSLEALLHEGPLEFARELDRFLKGEPVRARPPSAGERLRRWARWRRGVLLAAGSVGAVSAAALGRLEPAGLKDRLLELLGHGRPVVRRNAAELLGKIGDRSARPALEAAHRVETDPEAKHAMEDALAILR